MLCSRQALQLTTDIFGEEINPRRKKIFWSAYNGHFLGFCPKKGTGFGIVKESPTFNPTWEPDS